MEETEELSAEERLDILRKVLRVPLPMEDKLMVIAILLR